MQDLTIIPVSSTQSILALLLLFVFNIPIISEIQSYGKKYYSIVLHSHMSFNQYIYNN